MLVLTGVVSLDAVVGAASEGCATTVGCTTAAAAWPSCIASQDCRSMGKPTTGMGDGGGVDSICGVHACCCWFAHPPPAQAPVSELCNVLCQCASLCRLGEASQPRHRLMDDGWHFRDSPEI